LTPSSSIAGSQQQGGKKRINGPPPQPTLPAVRHAILELFARLPPQRCPHCRKWICNERRQSRFCRVPLFLNRLNFFPLSNSTSANFFACELPTTRSALNEPIRGNSNLYTFARGAP